MMQLARRTATGTVRRTPALPSSVARAAATAFVCTPVPRDGNGGILAANQLGSRRHMHSGSIRLAPAVSTSSKPKATAAKYSKVSSKSSPAHPSSASSSFSSPPSPPSGAGGSGSGSNGGHRGPSPLVLFVFLTLGASGLALVGQLVDASFFASPPSSSDEDEAFEGEGIAARRTSGGGDGVEPHVPHWDWDAYELGGAGVLQAGRVPTTWTAATPAGAENIITADQRAMILAQLRRAFPLDKRETVVAAMSTSEEEEETAAPTKTIGQSSAATSSSASTSASTAVPVPIAGRTFSVADLASIQQSHPLSRPAAARAAVVAPALSSSTSSSPTGASSRASPVVRDFAILTTRAAHSYAQACFLLDNPVGWGVPRQLAQAPTPAQVLAQEMLQTATQQLIQSLAYYQTHAQELCSAAGTGGGGGGPALSRVWAQWSALTDAQARLGRREATEGACAAFTTAVVQHASLPPGTAPGADKLTADISRAACNRIVFERLARVYAPVGAAGGATGAAAAGDWTRATLQMQRVLQASSEYAGLTAQSGAMSRREIGALASLNAGGNDAEIVEILAALSHAALATPAAATAAGKASSKASTATDTKANVDLALWRAQTAVALVGVLAEKLFVTSAKDQAAIEEATKNACELAQANVAPASIPTLAATQTQAQAVVSTQPQPSSPPPAVGQVPYSQLLSPATVRRVLDRELLYAHAVVLTTSKLPAGSVSGLFSSLLSGGGGGDGGGGSNDSGSSSGSRAAALSASKNAAVAARNHAYLLRRRRAAAIAYQQLGNALQAAGDTEQAHKAWRAAETMGQIQL